MPVTGCLEQADKDFLAQFETCALLESEWTHAAHVRVAWICLNQSTPDMALERIRTGILRYNTDVLNRRHKYHETVTVAFSRIVAARMRENEPWAEFARRIDDMLDTAQPLLLRYYSEDRLFSDEARTQFVEADLQELPPLRVD